MPNHDKGAKPERTSEPYTLNPIGYIRSCYKEKFGIPRQPGLVSAAKAELSLIPPYNRKEAVEGLEQTSHVWLQFIFHQSANTQWKPTVRPPRLGGNKRIGVFATRSPVRPNGLGLSVVKLDGIDTNGGVTLKLSGIDLVEGTPIVDIKPYIPYADAVTDATHQFAAERPRQLDVSFNEQAAEFIDQQHDKTLSLLIRQILQQDPRPSYQAVDETRRYGMHLLDFNVQWRYILGSPSKDQGDILSRIEVVNISEHNTQQG